MSSYYLDSSALSKRYVAEIGTTWLQQLFNPLGGHTFITARISLVEVHSALMRRHREGVFNLAEMLIASQALTQHSLQEYELIELDTEIVMLARDLLDKYPLRAYDAVQLASALVANQALQRVNLSTLSFISADNRLNSVAIAEGLLVDNPNLHP